MPPLWVILIGGLAVLVGSLIQATVGLGLALVAAPTVTILDPSLMPGSMLAITGLLPIATLLREPVGVDWRGLRWVFFGRIFGTAAGILLVAVVSVRNLGVAIGLAVLVAAVLSVVTWTPRPNPVNLTVAGLVGGAGATATSIGGPPVALVYQHSSPEQIRGTLAVYFLIGNLVSLTTLAATGHFTARQGLVGVCLIPFIGIGFVLSNLLRGRLDQRRTRHAVLLVSVVSALTLVVRSLVD